MTRFYDFSDVAIEGELRRPRPLYLSRPARGPGQRAIRAGDEAFAERRVLDARRHYLAALNARPRPMVRAYVHYQLGWLAFDLGDFDEAITRWQRARELASPGAFVRQIDHDLVTVWARQPTGRQDAERYFSAWLDPPRVRDLLEKLAELRRQSGLSP